MSVAYFQYSGIVLQEVNRFTKGRLVDVTVRAGLEESVYVQELLGYIQRGDEAGVDEQAVIAQWNTAAEHADLPKDARDRVIWAAMEQMDA